MTDDRRDDLDDERSGDRFEPDEGEPGGDDLLDLPLGTVGAEEDEDGAVLPGTEDSRGDAREEPPQEPVAPLPTEPAAADLPSRRRRNRLPFLLLLALALVLLLALAGVVGYLLPRPSPAVVRADPSMVDFGTRSVAADGSAREVRIASAGERPARVDRVEVIPPEGDAPAAFRLASDACSGSTVSPGQECVVAVSFNPAATGHSRATLHLEGDFANAPLELPLLGEGVAPHLVVEPGRLDFGSRAVGAEAVSRVVTVENDGAAPLDLDGVGVEGPAAVDFEVAATACTRRPIGPGESCPLSISFVPTAEGERRAAVRFRPAPAARGLEVPSVGLSGVGLAPRMAGRLEVAGPADADDRGIGFGAVIVRRERNEVLRLANRGEEELEIGTVGVTAGGEAFSVVAGGADAACSEGGVLASGAACEVRIRFAPAGEGSSEGELTVTGAGGAEGLEVALRGRGVIPRLVPRPVELRFEETRVGREGPSREVLFSSTGSATVEVAEVEVAGTDAGAFALLADACSGTALEPGEECRVEIGFRPRQEGVQSAGLRILSPSLDRASAVPLAGAGAAARIDLDPGSLAFGRVAATRAESLSLTVTSAGRAPLEVARVDVAGPDAGAFEVVSETCSEPLALAPGETCEITVRFAPDAEGERRALLVVAHDGVAAPARLELTGTALPAPAPRFRVAPERLGFGEQPVGGRSAIETVTVRNAGSARLVLEDVRITGGDAGDFRIVAGSCEGAPYVSPGSECTFGVRFVPTAPGSRRAEIVVRHNAEGGAGRVEVEGTGSGG